MELLCLQQRQSLDCSINLLRFIRLSRMQEM